MNRGLRLLVFQLRMFNSGDLKQLLERLNKVLYLPILTGVYGDIGHHLQKQAIAYSTG
jgi:hypothetical protein